MKKPSAFLILILFFLSTAYAATTRYIDADGIKSSDRTKTWTMPAATDTLVGKATTDTLTNKTFNADGTGNSITNIENADIKSGAAIAVNKMAALTASRAMVTDASGFSSASAVTSTEVGLLSGATTALSGFRNISFLAVKQADQGAITSGTSDLITFPVEVVDGSSAYNTSNSRFVAPATGKYWIGYYFAVASSTSPTVDHYLRINAGAGRFFIRRFVMSGATNRTLDGGGIVSLNSGDFVDVGVDVSAANLTVDGDTLGYGYWGGFYGHWVGP